jgi:hypothetical protein
MVRRTPEQDPQGGPERPAFVPWRVRVADIAAALVEAARARLPAEVLAQSAEVDDADADAFLEALACRVPLVDGRSLLRAFAEDEPSLAAVEREQLLRWERERRRAVYLVERCHPDVLEAWDPVDAKRTTIHLPERLPGARAAEVARGSVVVADTAPWGARVLARGRVEFWGADDALRLFRDEVRARGLAWHDLPPAAPSPSAR